MTEELRESGVLVSYPDSYREATEQAASRGTTRRGEGGLPLSSDALGAALGDWLQSDEFEIVDELALEAPGSRAAATPADPQEVELAVEVNPGQEAAILVEREGLLSWSFPGRAGATSRTIETDRAASSRTFSIPLTPPPAASRAGAELRSTISRQVKFRVCRFLVGSAAAGLVKLLEARVEQGPVWMQGADPATWQRLGSLAELDLPADRPARILLFVHGTFSSTVGSFGILAATPWGRWLLADLVQRYDAVVGFDHRTLGDSPEDNASGILAAMAAREWHQPSIWDAIAVSRGTLVLRSLIELQLPASELSARFRRAILVGGVNRGTRLAEPDNWHALLDTFTNLSAGVAGALSLIPAMPAVPVLLAKSLGTLGILVKALASGVIGRDGLPGLAAMEPDGDLVNRLNRTQPQQPGKDELDYFAVTSNFESEAAARGTAAEISQRIALFAADKLADRLMGIDNDLVVDNDSMVAVDPPDQGLLKEVLEFGPNRTIHHLAYLTHERVGGAVRQWLELPEIVANRPARREIVELADASGRLRAPAQAGKPVGRRSGSRAPAAAPTLEIEVHWGDVRRAPGDIYSVGHYQRVLPQNAELVLDGAVSEVANPFDPEVRERLVLTRMTRRNQIHSELGDISFFPWGGRHARGRLVAVCGMGFPGAFSFQSLRRLHRSLASSLLALPDRRQLTSILIGAGEGNLTVAAATRGLLQGFEEALRGAGEGSRMPLVRICEIDYQKACRILATLRRLEDSETLKLRLRPKLRRGRGRRASREVLESELLAAALECGPDSTVDRLLDCLPSHLQTASIRSAAEYYWGESDGDPVRMVRQPILDSLTTAEARGRSESISRVSFIRDEDRIRAAFITDAATVPERLIDIDESLLAEAVGRMTNPKAREIPQLSTLLNQLILPRDFRPVFNQPNPLILELGRGTAEVHWEMMASHRRHGDLPIGLTRQVARQLRTTYSPAPGPRRATDGRLTALVIGDPGDPKKGHGLPGARREARAVAQLFERLFDRTHVLIGAPGHGDSGVTAATRLDVLEILMRGEVDVLHYAGHGAFDPKDPRRAGWLFADGFLRSAEIARIDEPPSLIIANACLSGVLSQSSAASEQPEGRAAEASLLASLVDEFFKQGVLNYVGTAWEIDDRGAVEFAATFYSTFLEKQESLGESMLAARRAIAKPFGSLWAAYQLYGDPNFTRADL